MINNLKEKELLVTRKLIGKQMDFTDENIKSAWNILFPKDELPDTAVFEQIRKKFADISLEDCEKKLYRLRKKHEEILKSKGKCIGYSVKLIKQTKKRLATYVMLTKGNSYTGSFDTIYSKMSKFSKKK